MTAKISRRGFVAGVTAAAFTYGFRIPFEVAAADEKFDEVNAWVVVKPDDTVVIRIARSEMGQGTLTGLAQLVAEELCCDWSKVTTEYPTPATNLKRNLVWKSFTTVASRGIRELADYVRQGGAAAREMLIAAAAKEWDVPLEDCKAENSVITCERFGRKTTFGKVAAAAATIEPPKDVKLKDPKDWTIAGKPLKRLDTAGKLNGSQIYGIDLKLPGMLLASIKACPVAGGKVCQLRRVGGAEDARRQDGCAGGGHGRGRGGRNLVAGQDRPRCPAYRMGFRPERKGFERIAGCVPKARTDRGPSGGRQ